MKKRVQSRNGGAVGGHVCASHYQGRLRSASLCACSSGVLQAARSTRQSSSTPRSQKPSRRSWTYSLTSQRGRTCCSSRRSSLRPGNERFAELTDRRDRATRRWRTRPACANICSVTSQGHPYAIFKRALERRNLPSAWAAATELQVVSLSDALALCLLVRDREPAKFARLALRWHARFSAETPGVELETGRLILDLLAAIGGDKPIPVARALRELIACYDGSLGEPLRRWEVEHATDR